MVTRISSLAAATLVASSAVGCRKDDPKPLPTTAAPTTPSASASAPREWTLPSVKSEERDEAPDAPRVDGGAFATGALSDIGPAGPASASRFGVVMVTKQDEVVVAAPGKGGKGSFKSIALVASSFSEGAPPPAIAGDYAYFVARGKLVRRRIQPAGPLETLVDARDNTRVSALPATDARPAMVAYIASPEKPSGSATAMLWVEGRDSVRLSPEGTGASSVSLAESGSDAVVAVLDGRTGMTPVHARKIAFASKAPTLEENVVVWVAGPAQPTTEITLLADGKDAWIFSPIERETTRFGLAQVHIGATPKMGSPVEWRMYPNGIDPAPVAPVHACGRKLLFYVQPSTETPGAPQELRLAAVGDSGLEASDVLAKAPSIRGVSASSNEDTLLAVYGANGRTWALSSACPSAKKKSPADSSGGRGEASR